MLFIVVLMLSTLALAGSAAYFSVYGLANTFSGVFWSVVVMGASLEAGKLVAASYLYRYWETTNIALKAYLMAGVIALMTLTSGGIFGYLSAGYQTDMLPLRELEQRVTLLDTEKARLVARKQQIDDQIAKLPTNSVRGRTQLMRGFQVEQTSVTTRITQLDQEILTIKQQQIKSEAHVGPIMYIAKVFGLDSDNATKYLIFLIIFAFDPMAVALTLATNIALRLHKEQKLVPPTMPPQIIPEPPSAEIVEPVEVVEPESAPDPIAIDPQPVVDVFDQPPEPVVDVTQRRAVRPYNSLWTDPNARLPADKIADLMERRRALKSVAADVLTADERWELRAIEDALQRNNLDIYTR